MGRQQLMCSAEAGELRALLRMQQIKSYERVAARWYQIWRRCFVRTSNLCFDRRPLSGQAIMSSSTLFTSVPLLMLNAQVCAPTPALLPGTLTPYTWLKPCATTAPSPPPPRPFVQLMTPVLLPLPQLSGYRSHATHGLIIFATNKGQITAVNGHGTHVWQVRESGWHQHVSCSRSCSCRCRCYSEWNYNAGAAVSPSEPDSGRLTATAPRP